MLYTIDKNTDTIVIDELAIKTMLAEQETRMTLLQQKLRAANLPSIVVIEGWDASGKGAIISGLLRSLDPRGTKVYTIQKSSELERRYPMMYRYWAIVPKYGNMSLMDRSWYRDASELEDDLSNKELERRYRQILDFEKQLSDDGYVIIKLFLHISKQEQKKRLQKLEDDKNTAWRVTKSDWRVNRNYDEYFKAYNSMIERTNTESAPWHVVESHNRRKALHEIYDIIINALEKALDAKLSDTATAEAAKEAAEKALANSTSAESVSAASEPAVSAAPEIDESVEIETDESAPAPTAMAAPNVILSSGEGFELLSMPRLADVDLSHTLTDTAYRRALNDAQDKLLKLHNKLYLKRVPVILGFEGWDAAGKGGAIKRLTRALDPRGYEVHPTSAPTTDELAHQYLWRFWRNLPKDGHIEIFDRTWYGRVMVERIEGFCSDDAWQRAYAEINQFERSLTERGAVVIKFWLQISNEEQLARFNDRQNTPEKQWKITAEDWRNRDKWPQYEAAVNDMLQLTSTKHAPWVIVEANDKKFARVKVLETVIDAIEKKL